MSRGDRWLLVLPLCLTALGVIMVYSSSAILGITRYQDPNHYLFKQLVRVGLGLVVMWGAMRVDLRRLEAWGPALLAGAAALLLLVALVGHVSNGAARALRLGVLNLQPTEVARVSTVVFLARWFKDRPPAEHGFRRGLMPPLLVVGGVAGLILLQPNLSSAVLVLAVGMILLFLAGASPKHLAAPVVLGAAAAALALATHPYMMQRWTHYVSFMFGGVVDQRGSGWQLDQSLIAIGSGGWFGRGLGGGLQKFLFLPFAHTDFIFSILAEELGFVGSTWLLLLVVLLLWRGMRAAVRNSDPFASVLAAGLTAQIGLYALINLAVATGLAPTTGLPLPFVSYGGSALLANLAAAGLLYRVSKGSGAEEALARHRFTREAS